MQTILTVLAVIAGLVVAAFGLGRRGGKNAAETTAAAEQAAVQNKEVEKNIKVLKNAVDINQDVSSQPDADVSKRLRQKWRRESR